jgi:hypothetical protein
MNLNNSAVERNGFYFEAKYLLSLKAFKYTIKNSVLAPTVHASVNAVPTTEIFRQTAPLAPMFRKDMAFCSSFFPYPLDLVQRILEPEALLPCCRR